VLRSLTHVPIIASTAASRMFSTSQLEAEADPHGASPCAKAAAVCICSVLLSMLANVCQMCEGKKGGHWIKRGLALHLVLGQFPLRGVARISTLRDGLNEGHTLRP